MKHSEHLKFLAPYLGLADAVEICFNRFGEVWIETRGQGWIVKSDPNASYEAFNKLATVITNRNNVKDFEKKPVLSTKLPDGSRLELLLSRTLCKSGVSCSIRKKSTTFFHLEDFVATPAEKDIINHDAKKGSLLALYLDVLKGKESVEDFKSRVHSEMFSLKNVIVSGGTSSGKTQMLRILLQMIPLDTRILLVQDADEIDLEAFPNHSSLLINKLATDEEFDHNDALNHFMRSRPDRIILGEITVESSFSILRLLNSGHGGFMSSVHADDPHGAFTAIADNIRNSKSFDHGQVVTHLTNKIDLVFQVARHPRTKKRVIIDIYEK